MEAEVEAEIEGWRPRLEKESKRPLSALNSNIQAVTADINEKSCLDSISYLTALSHLPSHLISKRPPRGPCIWRRRAGLPSSRKGAVY